MKYYIIASIISFIFIWPLCAVASDYEAEVTTPWTGTGTMEDSNRPLIGDTYSLKKWEDTTGQPAENLQPDPNIYIIKIQCTEEVLNQIEADENYTVLWSEEVQEDTP